MMLSFTRMSRSIAWSLAFSFMLVAPASHVDAQRRRREPPPPAPATLTLAPAPADLPGLHSPYRFILRVEATEAIELIADRRLLELSIQAPGQRRPTRCRSAEHPTRASTARSRSMPQGAHYEEWIDLREICWGRALGALRAGGQVRASLGFTRRGRGRYVVRRSGSEPRDWATLEAPEFTLEPSTPAASADESEAAGARVSVRDADVRNPSRFSLRVSVRASGASRRVWLRPEHVSFVVRGPEGEHRCGMEASRARAIPDLFRRLTTRRGASFGLDVRQYCDEDVFRGAGIYEVVPVVDLDEDGSEWELDALIGHFEGEAGLVRVRRDARGYVERAPGGDDA